MTSIRRRSLTGAATATATIVGLALAPGAVALPADSTPSPSESATDDSGDDAGDSADDEADDEADDGADDAEPTDEPSPRNTGDSSDDSGDDTSDDTRDETGDDASPTPSPSESSDDGDGSNDDARDDTGDEGSDSSGDDQPATDESGDEGSGDEQSEEEAAQEAYEAALQDAYTRAVAEANRLLTVTNTQLEQAQAELSDARADAEAAREESEQAQQEAEVAQATAERTQRQITATSNRISSARNDVGTVARQAYQSNGLSTWGVFLDSEDPTEFTDRYVGMRTLLESGDAALGDLSADQANLRNAKARLAAQIELNEQKVEQAERKLADAEQAEDRAERAAEELEESNARYARALETFDEARAEDQQMYEEILDESLDLEEELSSGDYGSGEGTGEFVRPGNGSITSEFGQRYHPILQYTKMHTGMDFGAGDGRIRAADSGTVIKAEFNSAYGNMVVIDHGEIDGEQVSTMYAHQSGLSVESGQQVEKGQHIGQIGSTGYSTGPHLHFEVRIDGEPVNPRSWLE